MFFQLKSYLSFLIKSSTQHGVHSPFVYNLTTRCLRKKLLKNTLKEQHNNNQKKRSLSSKKETLLLNIISYFRIKKVLEITNYSKSEYIIVSENSSKTSTSITKELVDFFFLNQISSKENLNNEFNACLKNIHNNSIVIVNNIHLNHEMEKAWKSIKENSKVTVTIDIYHFGLVFFRKEQEKEDFIIRV